MADATDAQCLNRTVAGCAVQNGTPSLIAGDCGRLKYSGASWPKVNPDEVQVCSASTTGSTAPIRTAVLLVASNEVEVRWIW